MRVLIVGATGQVGNEIMRSVPTWVQAVGYGSSQLDITAEHCVVAVCQRVKPELIINAAAYTKVDQAEVDRAAAFAVNTEGVHYLGKIAASLDIPIFHISTDYVYEGSNSLPYTEFDDCNPLNVYGASKLAGEEALANTAIKHIILRTSWVFGCYGNNFVKTMLQLGRQHDVLKIIDDQVGCPTSARSIAAVLWIMVEQYREKMSFPWGIYNFCNAQPCNWYEFAYAIFDEAVRQKILAKSPLITPIPTTAYPQPAERPKYSVMDDSKLATTFGLSKVLWRSELQAMLRLMR